MSEVDSPLKIVPYRSGDLWGFANPDGSILIEPKYESAYLMDDGFGRIVLDNLTGLVDPDGKILVEPKYDFIGQYQYNRASMSIGNGLQGFLDENGLEVIPPAYDQVFDFQSERAIVVKDKKALLIRPDGSEVKSLPNFIPHFQEPYMDMSQNQFSYDKQYILIQDDKKYQVGLMDTSGKVLINTIYNQLSPPVNNVLVGNKGELYVLLRTDGTTITPMNYQYIYRIAERKFIAQKDDAYGVIDEQGNTIIPFMYSSLEAARDGYLVASNDSGVGMIDSTGKMVIPFIHTGLFSDLDFIISFNEDGKSGLLDIQNQQILPSEYDVITILNENRFLVSKDGKKGIVDKAGKEIVPLVYDGNEILMDGEDGYWSRNYKKTVVMLNQRHSGTLFSADGKKISEQKWMYCGYPDRFGLTVATDINGRENFIGPDGRIYSKDSEVRKVTVNSAQALFDAIGNDTEIILEQGEYDLTKIQGGSEYAKVNTFDDQTSIIIANVKNLILNGKSAEGTHLFTSSPYVPVIRIENSNNIELRGIRIGHDVEKGMCEGAVIQTEGVVYMQIINCDLYGSGTRGLESKYSSHIVMENSIIRECTYGILTLDNTFDCGFYSCQMYDNQHYDMVELLNAAQIVFEKSAFRNNHSDKAYGPFSFFKTSSEFDRFTLRDCTFENCSADYFLNFRAALEQEPDYTQGFIPAKSTFQFEVEGD